MKRKMAWAWFSLAVCVVAVGCSSPCNDYCATFVQKTQDCGLGGPSGDDVVESCTEEVEQVLADEVCDTANTNVGAMSCAEFEDLLCSQSNASQTYRCN